MAAVLIARFDGDTEELKRAYDRAHAQIMAGGGAVRFGELRDHCAIGENAPYGLGTVRHPDPPPSRDVGVVLARSEDFRPANRGGAAHLASPISCPPLLPDWAQLLKCFGQVRTSCLPTPHRSCKTDIPNTPSVVIRRKALSHVGQFADFPNKARP
jgi:hypothetical protein